MSREPDEAWEALVRVTNANPEMERGRLNIALKAIRICWEREGGLPAGLPAEIELRAEAYRNKWPSLTLTPTALATHWFRVVAERPGGSKQEQAIERLRRET
jgi:hypothetical protein